MSMIFPDLESPKLIEMIKAGAIGVIRTDTLYGVVAIATNKGSVERVYAAKKRSSDNVIRTLRKCRRAVDAELVFVFLTHEANSAI